MLRLRDNWCGVERSLLAALWLSMVALLPACGHSSAASSEGEVVPFPQKTEQAAMPLPQQPFGEWKHTFIKEARGRGIDAALLARAFDGLRPNERLIRLDRKQPEGTLSFADYLRRTVDTHRVSKGREMMRKHQALLSRIGNKYGVQPRFIVALWGKETNYGGFTGGTPVVEALATLAWEGRRSAFFRKELLDALRIVQAGHITLEDMNGSWAGAMGQTQFMPSSWWKFAVDENGDGRKDIWHTLPDVFASIANYLKESGWDDDQTWGREAQVPRSFDAASAGREHTKTLREWQRIGVRRADGADLPDAELTAAIVYPDDNDRSQTYLVYNNYNTIMLWNRSLYFATAVGILSDRVEN